MPTPRRRKCAHCRALFFPDPRRRSKHRYCGRPVCRKASKAESQRQWLAKPENKNWWRGPENVQHVKEWRKAHPGYWRRRKKQERDALQDMRLAQSSGDKGGSSKLARRALQDTWRGQSPLVLGLIAQFTGVTLQEEMAGITGQLIARGAALLGETNPENDHEENPLCGARAAGAGPV